MAEVRCRTGIWPSVAGGVLGLFGTVVSLVATRSLERFKAEHGRAVALLQGQIQQEQAVQSALLSDANAETQAARQYRFDALKRLYVEVSPLLFQMREPVQQARDQVKNLARAARDGCR
jgi:hypothetical protein